MAIKGTENITQAHHDFIAECSEEHKQELLNMIKAGTPKECALVLTAVGMPKERALFLVTVAVQLLIEEKEKHNNQL